MSYIRWWPQSQEMKASNITCFKSSAIDWFILRLIFSSTTANKTRCLTSDGDQTARKRRHQISPATNFLQPINLFQKFYLQSNYSKYNLFSHIGWWPIGQAEKASNAICHGTFPTNQCFPPLQPNHSRARLQRRLTRISAGDSHQETQSPSQGRQNSLQH